MNLYEILGLAPEAGAAAIKAAYRRKAKENHPDSGGDAEAFRLIKLAYDVLSNPDKRRRYDATGEIPADIPEQTEQAQLHGLATEVMMAALEQIKTPQFDDFLAQMRTLVSHQIAQATQRIAALQRLLDKIPEIAERIHSREGENVLRTLILHRKAEMERTLQGAQERRALFEKLLEMLADYDYELMVDSVVFGSAFAHASAAFKPGGKSR